MSVMNSNHITANCYENHTPGNHYPGAYKKPIRLKNVSTKAEAFDSLNIRTNEVS